MVCQGPQQECLMRPTAAIKFFFFGLILVKTLSLNHSRSWPHNIYHSRFPASDVFGRGFTITFYTITNIFLKMLLACLLQFYV